MRVVLDTKFIVSAAIKADSAPYNVVQWLIANGVLLTFPATEQELLTVLERPRLARLVRPDFVLLLRALLAGAEDDKFLALAVNGKADVIVSGDADLLALGPFRGIPIETPADFLRRVRG